MRKVVRIQRKISCAGCGLCCTERFNSVRILPIEAAVIASHLQSLEENRRRELVVRMRRSVERFGLAATAEPAHYTCPFLEPDFSCALPFAVKPVACLSFNPVDKERCDQSEHDYFVVFDAIEQRNAREFKTARRAPIPVLVLEMLARLQSRVPRAQRDRK